MIRGLAAAVALATFGTLLIAWPVVRAPTERIYGREIAGRHYDAYTVIQQFGAGAPASGITAQPLTDRPGWSLARIMPPVAAFNLVVLLTFPLTAAAVYLLARYLLQSHAAATIAAMFFTFAPLRLAHAAYHPHIVQTHWLALYVLALFALIDRSSWRRAAGVALAATALVLSNFYGGLIGAVLTPVVIAAYWLCRRGPGVDARSLVVAGGTAGVLGALAFALVFVRAPVLISNRASVAFDVSDVGRFSARWWAYFIPPVDHPLFGAWSSRVFARAGEPTAIVEEQVSMSYGLLVLAMIAVGAAVARWRRDPARRTIVAVAAIGLCAWLVSIGPVSGSCRQSGWAPACLLYRVAPMFRSYARFAFVTHLALAVAAAAGAIWLGSRSRLGRAIAIGLILAAALEYFPLPPRAHDVLPTAGHRWIAQQPVVGPIFDCAPLDLSLETVTWLMRRPVAYLSPSQPGCADPRIGNKLAIMHYTYLVARAGPGGSRPPEPIARLSKVAEFPDSTVFAVMTAPDVAVVATDGFYPYEHEGADWWQWMTSTGHWTLESGRAEIARVALSLRLSSAGGSRRLELNLDGQPVGTLDVGETVASFAAGPWEIGPGTHQLTFTASGAPFRPSDRGSADNRPLTVMFKSDERWIRVDDHGGR